MAKIDPLSSLKQDCFNVYFAQLQRNSGVLSIQDAAIGADYTGPNQGNGLSMTRKRAVTLPILHSVCDAQNACFASSDETPIANPNGVQKIPAMAVNWTRAVSAGVAAIVEIAVAAGHGTRRRGAKSLDALG
jgi:hypothetical protein